jgi:hypothetical protein
MLRRQRGAGGKPKSNSSCFAKRNNETSLWGCVCVQPKRNNYRHLKICKTAVKIGKIAQRFHDVFKKIDQESFSEKLHFF